MLKNIYLYVHIHMCVYGEHMRLSDVKINPTNNNS